MTGRPVGNRVRILFVEDTEEDAQLVLRELAREKLDVVYRRVDTARSLDDALKKDQWDVVITDYSLPSLDAIRVLQTVKQTGVDLPCIIVSSTLSEEAAVDALKAGAKDFIAKNRLARLAPAVTRELSEAAERQQRRSVEAALQRTRDRMQFALEAACVGTWEYDIGSGTMEWSELLERLHGLPEGRLDGTFETFISAVRPDDRSRVREVMARAVRDRKSSHLEYRVVWADETVHWIANVGRAVFNRDGQPILAGVAMDITLQKELEEQFHHSQRMDTMGALAGGIAHDFNNLLSAILGFSIMMLDEIAAGQLPDAASLRHDLGEIRRAGDRAAALTNQLLAFSRKQVVQPRLLNLNSVVDNIAPMLRRLIGEDVVFDIQRAPDLRATLADVGQIEQVLMNLAVNARDAMPTGGRMTIETANIEFQGTPVAAGDDAVRGPYVMLAVSDTGAGIPPEMHTKIFEPFFTTKPKGRGTGLGLATVYGIVKQSRGNITVHSRVGHGARFNVYLPASDEPVDELATQSGAIERGGGERILLVEDEVQVRMLAQIALVRSGYVVLEASGPEEALRVLAAQTVAPDLLLTDVVMPGMGGCRLAEMASAQCPGLRVLFMSGYTDDGILHHGVVSPGVAFLHKPFTPATITRAVREVLGKE